MRVIAFFDESFRLFSGIGMLNTAVAVSHLLTQYHVNLLINFGIAGAKEKSVGEFYAINKVTELASNTSFYPYIQ